MSLNLTYKAKKQNNWKAQCNIRLHDKGVITLTYVKLEAIFYTPTHVFSVWMTFGGNTRDLGSFGEEMDEITDIHQILEEVLLTGRGDGVADIKRRHRDPSSDGVRRFSDGVRM
ncbi:hypothetical protein Tco_0686469 [Tanacetum coccineum]